MAKRRKKRHFPKWLMLLSLGVLGVTLALLLTLLYLLYWMKSPIQLPDPARLSLRDPDLFFISRPDASRPEVSELLKLFFDRRLAKAPSAVQKVARYGLAPERVAECPLQMVFSVIAGQGGPDRWVAAHSMGRYRGALWLADRALRRGARDGQVPYGRYQHGDTFFYEETRSSRCGLPVLAFWRATGIVGGDVIAVGQVYDNLAAHNPYGLVSVPNLEGYLARGKIRRPVCGVPFLLKRLLGSPLDLDAFLPHLGPMDVRLKVGEDGRLLVDIAASCQNDTTRGMVAKGLRELLRELVRKGTLDAMGVVSRQKALNVHLAIKIPGG